MTRLRRDTHGQISVSIRADMSGLRDTDKAVLEALLEAAHLIDVIYLRQSRQFPHDEDAVFDPRVPKQFYPDGTTKEAIEAYLVHHPEMRQEILSPFTNVVATADGFKGVPYVTCYTDDMYAVSEHLERAAALSDDAAFRTFLIARARAFRTNQYRESDIAWIGVHGGVFECTIGPYEEYADRVHGIKRAFRCILGLVLPHETRAAAGFQEWIGKFDAMLGQRYGYTVATTCTPMVVIDQVYGSGEAFYSTPAMAYNLPNDLDIHAEVGSKKVFIRNVMRAKFETMTLPIAARFTEPHDFLRFELSTYLQFIVGHESAHGLSFYFDGACFGHAASGVEECKADVFGMWFLYFLATQHRLNASVAESAVMHNITDGLRQIRRGTSGAHAIGSIIQLNWFVAHGAVTLTPNGLVFTYERFYPTIIALGDALYGLTMLGGAAAVEEFVKRWGSVVPEQALAYLRDLDDLPVDINSLFEF